ncbi:MAG: hypothetical protein LC687_04635 [Actinobacteria bacterium]|nr:hypothetical protein [Actinomycetota bacterium]
MEEFKEYIHHGDFVFYAVTPLSFCKITHQQLFMMPGGFRVTEKWIMDNVPLSFSSIKNPPRIKR